MTQQISASKTHVNYVIAFSDGTLKIGVTRRPSARLAELARHKVKSNSAQPVRYACTPRSSKEAALKTERTLCSILKNSSVEGCREWFEPTAYSVASNFAYLKRTTIMLWSINTGRALGSNGLPV